MADIKVINNNIGGRQGWAYVFNSMKCVCIEVDNDKAQESTTFKEFGKVRVNYHWKSRNIDYPINTTLEWTTEDGFFLGRGAIGISARYSWYDAMEDLEYATAPFIKSSDDIVALVFTSQVSKTLSVSLFHIGRVDSQCQHVCSLNPLTDEEMADVVRDIERWLRR